MCGRFAMDKDTDDLIQEYVAAGGDYRDWHPGWNISPTDPIAVVIDAKKESRQPGRRLEIARWSLARPNQPQLVAGRPQFNVRSESAAQKYGWAVKSRRAIIPASGYYEWHTEGKLKTPFYIHPGDDELLSFAAVYSWWRDPSKAADDSARWVLTAALLTADAVPHLAEIHDRNPVMLPREWWNDWLNPELDADQSLVDAAVEASIPVAEALRFHKVAPPRGDGPELVAPATLE